MYLINGDTMNVKVTEISETEVRYNLDSNPNGPIYVISKTKVFMIEYANGSKDLFAKENSTKAAPDGAINRTAETVASPKRIELEKLYRKKLGSGIAGVVIGTLGTAIAGSGFAVSLSGNHSRNGDKIAYGILTIASITILTAGISGIVKAGSVRRELDALPVSISPAILPQQNLPGFGPEFGLAYGINLAFRF